MKAVFLIQCALCSVLGSTVPQTVFAQQPDSASSPSSTHHVAGELPIASAFRVTQEADSGMIT
jgi:hypothetical protein